ncbi:hypothetical protein NQ317_000333 [Molorchus minor]|uniref:long-chain-fatty-acid--CoA ligase n=1 Tax=Molorchus minor TaxID=1323400 RepID=A0ABQ9K084_9CUCU|nr:hypothetical protein NQ317_000333 [Molorchus minor]
MPVGALALGVVVFNSDFCESFAFREPYINDRMTVVWVLTQLPLDREMDGVGFTLAIGALRALSVRVRHPDFPRICHPPEAVASRQLARKDMAKAITEDTKSITYRSTQEPKEHHVTLIREKIDTMVKMFDYCAKSYPNKNCLGTREILAEEDEYVMGEYRWKTYSEVNVLATNFGRGLRALGNEPGQNIVIFAETRAEWMIAAHGLFKQNIPLITIYATLGDEAIAHGINETEVTTVITSFDLLPKFKKILALTPRVKTIIYMEDQLKTLENTNGYKEGVDIIKFVDVLKKGAECTLESCPPNTNDTAIIMYTSGSTGVPKGVILLHKNLITTLKVECVCLLTGVSIGYSGALTMIDSSSKIKKGTKGDASVLHPTCMTSVPVSILSWYTFRISKSVQEKVGKGSNVKKVIFKFAYDYKTKWRKRGYSTPLLDRVIFSPVKELMGRKHETGDIGWCPYYLLRPMNRSTTAYVYDHSRIWSHESTSCACVQDCTLRKLHSAVGEILLGGDNISAGYYKLPDKTEEDFFEADGKRWFKTGDICEVHPDGVIVRRTWSNYKLRIRLLGKVEAQLKTCPLIDNICVYGEFSKTFCVALVVPNQQQLNELATKKGIVGKTFEQLCEDPELEKVVVQELADHGKKSKLEKFELPAAIKLVDGGVVSRHGTRHSSLQAQEERYSRTLQA